MSADIVDRLRDQGKDAFSRQYSLGMFKLCNEAADEIDRLRSALDQSWRRVIAYPFGKVCKHLIAANMLSDMEELGFDITSEVAAAVVQADDETALAHPALRPRSQS